MWLLFLLNGLLCLSGIFSAPIPFPRDDPTVKTNEYGIKKEHIESQRPKKINRHTRNKCDTHSRLKNLHETHLFREKILDEMLLEKGLELLSGNKSEKELEKIILNRTKRWQDYDPNYNWENGGKEYTLDSGGEKKESDFEKYAKNWQKNTLKIIFTFCFVCMILCCCVACCKKVFSRLCEICCWHCKDWRDICMNRDPTYRRIRQFADDYGLHIDYEQYQKMKSNYEEAMKKQGYEFVDLSGRQ